MKTRQTRAAALALAACTTLACGTSEEPATISMEPFRHLETDNALAPADIEVAAIDYVRRVAGEADLGLSAADDLEVRAVVQGVRDGLRHVRLKQTYAGVPVAGSEVVVHADETTFVGVNGHLTRNLDGFDTSPTLAAEEAVAIARTDRSAAANASSTSELVILPRADRGADLAWHVQVAGWDHMIDARSGAVLRAFDAVPRLEQASGPGGDQSGGWVSQLDVEPSGEGAEGDFWMKTDRMETYDLARSEDVPVSGSLEEMTDPFANDAHGFAEVTLNMMRDWYGFNSVDNAGRVVKSYINDSSICPENTACAPLEGDSKVYFTVSWPDAAHSLAVVAHEHNHNFTEFHSNLTYSGEGADLHEHFSVVAAAIAEFYQWDGGRTGEIDHMCDLQDGEGGGGKASKAFCLAVGRYRAIEGGSATEAIKAVGGIWYQANAAYWTPSTDLVTACQGTIDASLSLGIGMNYTAGLRDSWADVGIDCAGPDSFQCDTDGECDSGETCASCPDDCGACSEDCSWWKKAKCKIGIGDCSQCDEAEACGNGQCDGNETDGTCGEDCGCQAADSCTVAPFGCWCDSQCLDYGDCCADISNSCG